MKLAIRSLDTSLKKGVAPLYAIHGAEALLALEAADRIRDAARKSGATEREIFFAEPGADWSKLGASAANMSLFASKRLMEIRIPTGKPGAEGGKAIDKYCARLPEDTVTLIVLPELDWQSLKTAWFSAIDAAGQVIEAKPVTRDELPEWLAERLSRQGQRASLETLEWLAERVEGNLLAAKQEVEKLGLLLPKGDIALAAIRDAVTDVSRFERDALIEAMHAGDASRVARVVDSLKAEGEPLPLLLWTLTEELRKVMAIAAGQRPRGWMSPQRTEALGRTAKRHDRASIGRELLRAHRIDRMIKGVEPGDPWDSVVELALGIAGKPVMKEVA